MGRRGIAALAALLVLAVSGSGEAAAKRAPTTTADPFTLEPATARKAGQIELLTRSTLPDAVTGGDVLVAVRGLREGDRLAVRVGRRSVTRAFGPLRDGERTGLVEGLRVGTSRITAVVRRGRRARKVVTLGVRNHPVTGPVLSGPHQEPFICETEQSGLGKPLDDDCSIAPRVQFLARTASDWVATADPARPPSGTQRVRTQDGRTVPFVVRLETRTVNRGITRLAVLHDGWSKQLTYLFGESCGVGYHQGRAPRDIVLGSPPSGISADTLFATIGGLEERLSKGDLIAYSSQSAFGVLCNPLVSIETLMMVKEHVAETFGEPGRTQGLGGSGGALQQYNAANNAPGLLDAALPIGSFTDVLSTAMTVADCGLLTAFFDKVGDRWSDAHKMAVAGHITTSICRSWRETFLPVLDPARGCASIVPKALRYDATLRPGGVRCTLQDATKNIFGTDPATGFARRPLDNVGVQYGLAALNDGAITPAQFLELNREVGGFDLDGRQVPQRMAMHPDVAARAYRLGGVVGRGSLDRIPILDLATYLDLIPIADIHDHVRPFMLRERLRKHSGGGSTMSIWRGVSLYGDAYPAIDRWLDGIERRGPGVPSVVADARPPAAADRCVVGLGIKAGAQAVTAPFGVFLGLDPSGAPAQTSLSLQLPERQEAASPSLCARVFRTGTEPRVVAGGPFSDDVLKCALKPVDPADYRVRLTEPELADLRRTFPDGVCDWSKPGVGEVRRSMPWPSLGGARLQEPRSLRWRIARSR